MLRRSYPVRPATADGTSSSPKADVTPPRQPAPRSWSPLRRVATSGGVAPGLCRRSPAHTARWPELTSAKPGDSARRVKAQAYALRTPGYQRRTLPRPSADRRPRERQATCHQAPRSVPSTSPRSTVAEARAFGGACRRTASFNASCSGMASAGPSNNPAATSAVRY